MKIGIIAAMQNEAKEIKRNLSCVKESTVSGITFTEGSYKDKEVVLAVCGIGKVFAALCCEAMILRYSPDVIINTGVAGGVSSGLSVFDIVVASSFVQHDMDTSPIGDPVGLISGINKIYFDTDKKVSDTLFMSAERLGAHALRGVVATGDQFVASKEQKDKIKTLFSGNAAEMEGGAMAQVCYVNSIPFGAIRSISDGADGEAAVSYTEFADKAADTAAKLVLDFLLNY